jgi:hypothetical protein
MRKNILATLLTASALVALGARAETAAPAPAAPAAHTNDDCLTCHSDATLERADKTKLKFDPAAYPKSVHGVAGAACVDCHADLATAELPHAEKVAKVDCSPCHGQQVDDYKKSFHAESRAKSPASKAATCADCHGTHDILASKDPAARTNHFNLPATCLRCHGDPKVFPRAARLAGNDPKMFADSIHGKALMKSGLTVAPNCATCHGWHEIRRPEDPASSVARPKVPQLCGSCHSRIDQVFETSVHGQQLKKGNTKAPVCIDCHTAHAVRTTEQVTWRLSVIKECGTCHESFSETYRDTYHGQVTSLGFTRVAACADCHGAHDVLPASDPRSTVSKERRLETCQKCHKGATANFAKYDPHADPRDKARSPFLYYTALFMRILLAGVFGFFGIHTALWLPRSWKTRSAKNGKENHHGR